MLVIVDIRYCVENYYNLDELGLQRRLGRRVLGLPRLDPPGLPAPVLHRVVPEPEEVLLLVLHEGDHLRALSISLKLGFRGPTDPSTLVPARCSGIST